MSIRDQILEAASKRKGKTTPVKAWGVDCFIKTMSGTERDAWEVSLLDKGKVNRDKFRAKLVSKTLVDQNGAPIFTDPAELSELDCKELSRLYDLSAKANGLSEDDENELTKNS